MKDYVRERMHERTHKHGVRAPLVVDLELLVGHPGEESEEVGFGAKRAVDISFKTSSNEEKVDLVHCERQQA